MDLNLRERTVVILGPLTSTVQNLIMSLTQQGADVALIDANADQAQRFCTNVSDQREVNSKFGRAGSFKVNLSDAASIREGISQAAQTFGSIDIFIDALVGNATTEFPIANETLDLDGIYHAQLKPTLIATQVAINFLKSKKRGRILYLLNDSYRKANTQDALSTVFRTGLLEFAKTLSRQLQEFNITVNTFSIGLTEEYLLGHFPDCKSIKEAQEKAKSLDPLLKITEPDKISNSVLFLVSQTGAAINGQHISLS